MAIIIDVSSFNGKIDWDKVSEKNPDLVIIRCGYGKNVKKQDDRQFINNIEGAIAKNIPVSVYLYSYAIDKVGAENEAIHALRIVEPYKDKINKVFIACEEEGTEEASAEVAECFCSILNENGYSTGVRATLKRFKENLKDVAPEDRWVVSWGENDGKPHEEPDIDYLYWQYTNTGSVYGINTDVALSTDKVKSYVEDDGTEEVELKEPEPAPAPAPKKKVHNEYEGKYKVTSKSGLNMRSGAGMDNPSIAVLSFDTEVVCDGEHKEVDGDIWLKVSTDGKAGFCKAKFLTK